MSKHEKPQPKNPHCLTINQHVFPVESMQRFANSDGCVEVFDKDKNTHRSMKPDNPFFCAMRSWDQRAESGYMKSIENAFKDMAAKIHDGSMTDISSSDYTTVANFYALWFARAKARILETQETPLNGVTGEKLTKDEEEILEKKGVLYIRENKSIPSRAINGINIQTHIDMITHQLNGASWGIVKATDGEFLVPDRPSETMRQMVPLNPTTILIAETPNGEITKETLVEINTAFFLSSQKYYFGNDLAKAIYRQ